MHLQNTIDNAFGFGVGVTQIKLCSSLRIIIACSDRKQWGIWNMATFKPIAIFEEDHQVDALEVIGASGDANDVNYEKSVKLAKGKNVPLKENLLTIAVVISERVQVTGKSIDNLASYICIYTLDTIDCQYGINSSRLIHTHSVFITSLLLFKPPAADSLNFSISKNSSESKFIEKAVVTEVLIATTDEGRVMLWDTTNLRMESEAAFRLRHDTASVPVLAFASVSSPEKPLSSDSNNDLEQYKDSNQPETDVENDEEDEEDNGNAFLTIVQAQSPPKLNRKPINFKRSLVDEPIPTCSFRYDEGGNYTVEKVQQVLSYQSWGAHADTITSMIPLADHGCLVTASHDGYQRVWNIDGECLGELLLPNVPEKMANPEVRVVKATKWKFILERIPVTQQHKDIAADLVRTIADQKLNRKSKRFSAKPALQKMQPSSSLPSLKATDEPNLPSQYSASRLPGFTSGAISSEFASFVSSQSDKEIRDLERSLIFKDLLDPPLPDLG